MLVNPKIYLAHHLNGQLRYLYTTPVLDLTEARLQSNANVHDV